MGPSQAGLTCFTMAAEGERFGTTFTRPTRAPALVFPPKSRSESTVLSDLGVIGAAPLAVTKSSRETVKSATMYRWLWTAGKAFDMMKETGLFEFGL